MTEEVPLAGFWAHLRAMRSRRPDEVHKRTIAREELRKHRLRHDDPAGVA